MQTVRRTKSGQILISVSHCAENRVIHCTNNTKELSIKVNTRTELQQRRLWSHNNDDNDCRLIKKTELTHLTGKSGGKRGK